MEGGDPSEPSGANEREDNGNDGDGVHASEGALLVDGCDGASSGTAGGSEDEDHMGEAAARTQDCASALMPCSGAAARTQDCALLPCSGASA